MTKRKKRFDCVLLENLSLEKFVNGGQTIGYTKDGKTVFVWGGLPGEVVDVLITKKRKGILEGLVQEVKLKSQDRVEPKNGYEFLSTSPWQILDPAKEAEVKRRLLVETFQHEVGIDLEQDGDFKLSNPKDLINFYGYRNKMEYNFWGDEEGIHLALHKRGSGQKIKLKGSVLASDAINNAGVKIINQLNQKNIFAGDLKSLVLRSNQAGECVGALFVKKKDFTKLNLVGGLKGLVCYYSDPKSPASVATEELWRVGEVKLSDQVLGTNIAYDVDSFFQVNVGMFEEVIKDIKEVLGGMDTSNLSLTDFYGGVGSIGISLKSKDQNLKIVELDESSARMAKENLRDLKLSNSEVSCKSSEESLEEITRDSILVIDPPRAGLHKKVVQKITEAKPKILIYLSCNPVTQARDIKDILEAGYQIKFKRGYNFFPRTPHIENLLILECQ